MWLLGQYNKNNTAYKITCVWKVQGVFCEDLLEQCVNEIVQRHDILRTTFVEKNSELIQIINKIDKVKLYEKATSRRDLHANIDEFLDFNYQLDSFPLFRFGVFRLDESLSYCVFDIHHIICDGWSLNIFFKELSVHYLNKIKIPLVANEITASPIKQYKHYSSEEELLFENEALTFWKILLKDYKNIVLPRDKKISNDQCFSGNRVIKYLSSDTGCRINLLATQLKCSTFSVYMAAYLILLHKITGEDDILVGYPVANRTDPSFNKTIGLFVNSLMIRINFQKIASNNLKCLIDAVHSQLMEGLQYQSYPFEKIVENLNPERSLAVNPFFQTMISLDNTRNDNFSLPDCVTTSIDYPTKTSRFFIENTIWERPDGVKIRFNYNTAVFEHDSIMRYVDYYISILDTMSFSNEGNSYKLEEMYYEIDDRDEIRGDHIDLSNQYLLEGYLQNVRKYPSRTAVECSGKSLSYSELDRASLIVKSRLQVFGNSIQDVVLDLERGVDLIPIIVGAIYSGYSVVPLNIDNPINRKISIIKKSDRPLLITEFSTEPFSGFNIPVLDIADVFQIFPSKTACQSKRNLNDINENIIYKIYTSGSTGEPKCIPIKHKNIVNTVAGALDCTDVPNSGRLSCWSNISFDIFFLETFVSLAGGLTLNLLTKNESMDLSSLTSALKKTEIFHSVPAVMQKIVDHSLIEKIIYPCVKCIFIGGDLVTNKLLSSVSHLFPNSKIFVLYGPTEATVICTVHQYMPRNDSNVGNNVIGLPLCNMCIAICDRNGNRLPRGSVGNIFVSGIGVFENCSTDSNSINDFYYINSVKYFNTGDVGRINCQGILEYIGRDNQQTKISGARVNLNEISNVLETHHLVKSCKCITTINLTEELEVVPYVVLGSDDLNNNEDIHSNKWKDLFNLTHKNSTTSGLENDFKGWNSAITGNSISLDIMQDWHDSTIRSIISELDSNHLKARNLKILEIGCGTGLLISSLLPYCKLYSASDFSENIIKYLIDKYDDHIANGVLELHCADAMNIFKILDDKYDVIILNSVVQYFPGFPYFRNVLECCLERINTDGCIFVGDIRNPINVTRLYREIVSSKYSEQILEKIDIERLIAGEAYLEDELLISPETMVCVSENIGLKCIVSPRGGTVESELVRFRYNAVLREKKERINSTLVKYHFNSACVADLVEAFIASENQILQITDICNQSETTSLNTIRDYSEAVIAKGLFYRWVFDEEEMNNYDSLTLLVFKYKYDYFEFSFDVNKLRIANINNLIVTNNPRKKIRREIEKQLILYLKENLPSYMVPRQIEFIDNFPLSENGKVDLKAFPVPRYAKQIEAYVEPRNKLEKSVCGIWEEILSVHKIGIDDNFFSLGGTSLLVIQAAILLQKNGVIVRPQTLFKYQTIRTLSEHISNNSQIDLISKSLVKGSADHIKIENFMNKYAPNLNCVFLLGVTGYLGHHLLMELLKNSQVERVYCLVRKDSTDAPISDRFLEINNHYRRNNFDTNLFEKVVLFEGDTVSPDFGLTSSEVDLIASDVSCIINAAALVSHLATEEKFEDHNFVSVKRIADFISKYKNKHLIHISTIGVKGVGLRNTEFSECDLNIGQDLTEFYSYSKLKAEIFLNQFRKHNSCDIQIYRVGTIAFRASDGIFQRNISNHFFSRFLFSVIHLGFCCDLKNRCFTLTPVDFMAHIIVRLSVDSYQYPVKHINSPHKISYFDLIKWLNQLGYNIRIISHDDFINNIRNISNSDAYYKYIDGVLQLTYSETIEHIRLNSDRTMNEVASLGEKYPKITFSAFKNFINYGIDIGYFPTPEDSASIINEIKNLEVA